MLYNTYDQIVLFLILSGVGCLAEHPTFVLTKQRDSGIIYMFNYFLQCLESMPSALALFLWYNTRKLQRW